MVEGLRGKAIVVLVSKMTGTTYSCDTLSYGMTAVLAGNTHLPALCTSEKSSLNTGPGIIYHKDDIGMRSSDIPCFTRSLVYTNRLPRSRCIGFIRGPVSSLWAVLSIAVCLGYVR